MNFLTKVRLFTYWFLKSRIIASSVSCYAYTECLSFIKILRNPPHEKVYYNSNGYLKCLSISYSYISTTNLWVIKLLLERNKHQLKLSELLI